MKGLTLGKGLCVLLLFLCFSVLSYGELILQHGVVGQQLELRKDPLSAVSEMPVIRQLKDYLERRRFARCRFNADIEEAILHARFQRKVVHTAA